MSVIETLVDVNTDNFSDGIYVIKISNEGNHINEIQKIQVIK